MDRTIQNCSLCFVESGPHVIHGPLGPPESPTQMASRSVHPFLQGSQNDQQTDTQTDTQTTLYLRL